MDVVRKRESAGGTARGRARRDVARRYETHRVSRTPCARVRTTAGSRRVRDTGAAGEGEQVDYMKREP